MKKIYLDYASSTPVLKEVFKSMEPYFSKKYGNPGSLHSFGQEAIAAVNNARKSVAKSINADFSEIIFTSSATEANNLILRGVVKKFWENKKTENDQKPKIIISSIEHESIIETALDLEKEEKINLIFLKVDGFGKINLKDIEKEIDKNTILISVMYVNNEVGVTEPISSIAEIVNKFRNLNKSYYPIFHSDAAQALMYFDCDVKKMKIDSMTISGQKINGPKGVGALYINENLKNKILSPIITGGGQEFKIRSGTENTPAIVGMGKAIELASKNREKNKKYVSKIKNYFWNKIKRIYKNAKINGASDSPHILNIDLEEETTSDFLIALDINGIAASAGSACQARFWKPSHVLKAMGISEEKIRSSLRFSFGINTTKKEIDIAASRIKKIKERKKLGA